MKATGPLLVAVLLTGCSSSRIEHGIFYSPQGYQLRLPGDGRIVVTAASKYGARGVGIDLDPERVRESVANVEKAKVKDLVEIRKEDALKVEDLERATVVMLYMLPEFMRQLKPIVLERCKPGTRVVSHDYPFPGWTPQQTVSVPNQYRLTPHTLYLWVVPARKAG